MLIKNPPVKITENLMMLGTTKYPIYLVKDAQEGAIFEGGVGAMGPVLEGQLADLDLPEGYVKQLVVTHAHPDHVMAVPAFRKLFPGVKVCASEAAAGTLLVEKVISFFSMIDKAITDSLLKSGSIEEEHRPKPLAEMKIPVDNFLADGDFFSVGSTKFAILETPGHSDCSLSFHDPASGVLIISDATGYYLPDEDFLWPNYFTDYAAYLASIRRLAQLDAEILCLSHNAVIQGAAEIKTFLERAVSETEAYHQRILQETKAGKSPRDIAGALGSEVFEKTQLLPLDFFQKNCALMVKLSLKHEGLGEKRMKDEG